MTSSIFKRIAWSLGYAALINIPFLGVLGLSHTAYASDQSTLSEFPGRRVGGGSRGACMHSDTLVSLSPENHLIETTDAIPTLYFSMPEFEEPLNIEFVLKNVDGEIVADKLLEVDSYGGLMGLDLEHQITPLDIGEDYEWYLSLLCNENNRAQDIVVHGWIRRVSATDLEEAESNIELIEQAQSYQEQGLWHDAIDVIIQARQANIHEFNATELWSTLLEAEGLQELVDVDIQPIVPSTQSMLHQNMNDSVQD